MVDIRDHVEAIVAGCEAAWRFFGGVFKVLVPDNMKPIVARADAVNPQFTVGWLEYCAGPWFRHRPRPGPLTQDKPRVERQVQLRGNFFAGEEFVDLTDAQARAETWCAEKAGQRIHGTICARPAEVFTEQEAAALLPAPEHPYRVPIYVEVTVHRDYHVQVGKALYSAPKHLIGQRIQARADAELVKLFHRGQLVKTHPRQAPGHRSADPADLPAEKTAYALRDLQRLITAAAAHGPNVGIYAERLLDHDLPWTKTRRAGCWGWPNATAAGRPTPRARGRSTSTSSPSPRSPPCSNAPPRTPRHRRREQPAASPRAVRPRPCRIQTGHTVLADRHRRRRRRAGDPEVTKTVVQDPIPPT